MNAERFRAVARDLFAEPLSHPAQWGIVAVVGLAFVFIPQLPPPSDWARNTEPVVSGILYANPDFVYPPWSIPFLWVYRLLSAPGSRLASVLVLGWLTALQRWPLWHFFLIVFSPYFLWTMTISNADVLVLVLPVVLWDAVDGSRWQTAGRSTALVLALVKPQGSWLLILWWLWRTRTRLRQWLVPGAVAGGLIVTFSLVGKPLLFLQWMHNVAHPSPTNQHFWAINNVSLTSAYGAAWGMLLVIAGGALLAALFRWRGRPWTPDHTVAALFLAAMQAAPYTSNQSIIAPLAFVPGLASLVSQYLFTLGPGLLEAYRPYDQVWTLLIGLAALTFYRPGAAPDHQGEPL